MNETSAVQYACEDSFDGLVDRLVVDIERALTGAVAQRRFASFVTSGGLTPMPLLEKLGRRPLPWGGITVSTTDERCVPTYDPQSNEGMVRRTLMRGAAAKAHFVGLHADTLSVAAQPEAASQRLASISRPFDFVLLGMGEDGHFASLFPGQAAAGEGLDPMGTADVVMGFGRGTTRVSLSLSALLDTRHLVLLVTGDAKRKVLEQARASVEASANELPVRALLRQRRAPVRVCWCPAEEPR